MPGAYYTELDSVNDAGTIVGESWDQYGFTHGFMTPTP
jgi:probable HAF family extracellular repeat protein